jgi:hypothetical protein
MRFQTSTKPGGNQKTNSVVVLIAPFQPWDSFYYAEVSNTSPLRQK